MPLLILAVLAADRAAAQEQPCTTCLTVSLHTELSSDGGPVIPSLQQYVVRRGTRYFVSPLWVEPQIAIYDSTGAFRRVFERRGQGPGEFRSFARIFPGPEGTVYAYERNRIHGFDAELGLLRSTNVERVIASTAAILPQGWVVVDDRFETSDGSIAKVSILDLDGSVREVVEAEAERTGRVVIAPAADGGFWTVRANRVRLYSAEAEERRSITIRGGVVEDSLESGGARHADAVDRGDGSLLLLAWIPDPDREPRRPDEAFVPSEEDLNQAFSTAVQWVDASTGQVRAIAQVPELLRPVGGAPDLMYSVHEGPLGHAVTKIWRIEVPVRD